MLSDDISEAMLEQQRVALSASENVGALVELNESVVSNNQSHSVSEGDLLKLADTLKDKLSLFRVTNDGWDASLRPKKPADSTPSPGAAAAAATETASGDDDIELF